MPSSPSAPSLGQRSGGNSFKRSISAARGAISVAAKSRTVSRSISTVLPWSNRNAGSSIGSLLWRVRPVGKHHQGLLLHGGNVLAVVSVHLGACDGERSARLNDVAARKQRGARRGQDVHLV